MYACKLAVSFRVSTIGAQSFHSSAKKKKLEIRKFVESRGRKIYPRESVGKSFFVHSPLRHSTPNFTLEMQPPRQPLEQRSNGKCILAQTGNTQYETLSLSLSLSLSPRSERDEAIPGKRQYRSLTFINRPSSPVCETKLTHMPRRGSFPKERARKEEKKCHPLIRFARRIYPGNGTLRSNEKLHYNEDATAVGRSDPYRVVSVLAGKPSGLANEMAMNTL